MKEGRRGGRKLTHTLPCSIVVDEQGGGPGHRRLHLSYLGIPGDSTVLRSSSLLRIRRLCSTFSMGDDREMRGCRNSE